jgi:rod shape-determining protein MreD
MRYTAFLFLGLLLIVLQGEIHLLVDPLHRIERLHGTFFEHFFLDGFRPALLVPLFVYVGVAETNLALGAGVAFLLGYVVDVVFGAPIGLHAFTSVATVALARIAGLRIVTQGGWARALLAGAFAAFASVVGLILLAIFGRPYVPRAMLRQVIPHAIATALVSPLVYRLVMRTQTFATGFLGQKAEDVRRSLEAPAFRPARARDEEKMS